MKKRMPFWWYVSLLLRGRNPWKEDRRLWELAQQQVEDGGIVMSREFTREEVRDQLLDHVWSMIHYWQAESRAPTEREKLEGLAFSILSALDGSCVGIPKFIVAPDPHPADRPFHIEQGENYFPCNDKVTVACDLGGELHEHFHNRAPNR